MKKIIIVLLTALLIPLVEAEGLIPEVEKYVNGKPYWDDFQLTSTWAYDPATSDYIKIDENGDIVSRVANINDDPTAKRGSVSIKANVPDNLKDKKIKIVLYSYPYKYEYVLEKNNNFSVSDKVVATNYIVTSLTVDNTSSYSIDYPNNINVYENETSIINLDYSKYAIKTKVKREKNNDKSMIILIIIGGVALLFVCMFAIMFIKAKNI